ncbi:MAG: UDP-N-acetylglucosamine--undecaprenyl-phosphate N-acetylglucosaminephosphotransferase [Plesiomonas sp.]|uniref:UDP-N-acetylglucosamine--undecaprenyl-phosphate N-acetylglucosaminephosphotransferase n=1 Tax=Plesiomonas sp. TaxID=2486279 RepID=UPI003F2B93D9
MTVSVLIAFVTTALAIFCLRPISATLKLVDLPNKRKQHVGAIPLIGGIAICCGVLISSVTTLPLYTTLSTLLGCGVVIVILGAIDDAYDISPWLRLAVQAVLILALCNITNITLHQFGNVLAFGDISLIRGVDQLVAVLAICAAINAYNMMDGIDGLAGSMAAISLAGLALLFFDTMPVISSFCVVIIAALIPYLLVNLTIPPFKKKIFMGDAGSMFLGFIIGYLVLYGSQQTMQNNAFRPVTALWLIGLPLMDMVGIMIRRIRKGQSPLRPDRNHLHHILLHAGFSSKSSLAIIIFFAAIFVSIGVIGEKYQTSDFIMMLFFLMMFLLYSIGLSHAWKFGRWIKLAHKNN